MKSVDGNTVAGWLNSSEVISTSILRRICVVVAMIASASSVETSIRVSLLRTRIRA
jgi:hypothetical protein